MVIVVIEIEGETYEQIVEKAIAHYEKSQKK